MAKTSVERDQVDFEVRRLANAGVSQRQIASRLGITRPMVQRILAKPDQRKDSVSDPEVASFRSEVTEAADTAFANGDLSQLQLLEECESEFNAEHGLQRPRAVQAAKLRRMMLKGALRNS